MKKLILALMLVLLLTLSACGEEEYTQAEVDAKLENVVTYNDNVLFVNCNEDMTTCELILNVTDTEQALLDAIMRIQELELRVEELEQNNSN